IPRTGQSRGEVNRGSSFKLSFSNSKTVGSFRSSSTNFHSGSSTSSNEGFLNVHINRSNYRTSRKYERNKLTIVDQVASQINDQLFLHTLYLIHTDSFASVTRTEVIMNIGSDVTARTNKHTITERSYIS